jgi:acetyl-CoA C-acetyltransferase
LGAIVYVANSLAPALSGQSHLGALLADFSGLRGVEATTIESAGASGGVATRQAYLALASGAIDTAMVLGVEKVTDKASGQVEAALATASDADYEAVQGVTATAQAALLMRRYLHEHNAPADALAGFSLTAHANAVSNPNAMFRREIKPEQYDKAPIISDPLNTYDAAPLADGAAALILARAEVLPEKAPNPRVEIAGSAVSTSAMAIHDQPDPLWMQAGADSAREALQQSGLSLADISLFELHDRFSVLAALSLEAAGLAERGSGWSFAQNGAITLSGKMPISTFGGSKARGDTGGATGVYQMAEATLQLQGRAGENQVQSASAALVQCLGGVGATAATHVLKSEALLS